MRRLVAGAVVAVLAVQFASAQFNIKLPKIQKPEQTKTVPDGKQRPDEQSKTKNVRQTKRVYQNTPPTSVPLLIKTAIDVRIRQHNEYWKFPGQRNFSSWVPDIRLPIHYDDSRPLKWTAAFFNPDGSSWLSYDLEYGNPIIRSPNLYDQLNSKSTNAIGLFSFKITDKETGATVFQGKFKVGKFLATFDAVRDKNKFGFFVDHDWTLPFASIGFDRGDITKGINNPTFRVWLKGKDEPGNLEARLFFNGAQIASTSDNWKGNVVTTNREALSDLAPAFAPNNIWTEWEFVWGRFPLENGNEFNPDWYEGVEDGYKGAHWMDKNPGEYTVKVFRGGKQVREAAFRIGSDNRLAAPVYSDQVPLPYHRIVIPSKVTDPMEKWNQNAWKTEAFFGNPLNGFAIQ